MGLAGAYLHVGREEHGVKPSSESLGSYDDFVIDLSSDLQRAQASRCMNCGVPFCQSGLVFGTSRHATGCPLHNLIPETNDLLFRNRLDDAGERLSLTNPFPEFTGRVCPAPCEMACNLGLNDDAVTIHDNERAISDYLWEQGLEPLPAAAGDAPLVSIIGSGPAGLAAAWELARRGMRVCVYEKDDRPGGLLMYGIPNMKLPKWVVDRRIKLMEESGIQFECGVDATTQAEKIAAESDAVIMACGARSARRMDIPGADLEGVHYALEYLTESTKALLDGRDTTISAQGKDVAVIGGGDTGVDCIATALRQGARSVRQIIRASRPADIVDTQAIWPAPRNTYSQAYGQREAADLFGEDPRMWSTDTLAFVGEGNVTAVQARAIGSDEDAQDIPADLVLIAKGFTGPEQTVIDAFDGFDNVFVAGDAHLGSTLVATAMADALDVANEVASKLH